MIGALAVAFVVWTFARLLRQVDFATLQVAWLWVALSLLPLVVGVYVLAYAFAVLLGRLSHEPVPIGLTMSVHVESQLARYTPGKVGVPLVRFAAAQQLGVTRTTMASAIGIEALCFLAVGGACGLSLLVLTSGHAPAGVGEQVAWLTPVVIVFAIGVLALAVVDRRLFPRAILHALKITGEGALVPAVLLPLHAAYWVCWMLHGFCVSYAVGAPPSLALASTGLYVLAPIVGFLALVAPAGAGVREALLTAGLAPGIGATAALSAAVLSRMVSVLVDFGTWLASRRR